MSDEQLDDLAIEIVQMLRRRWNVSSTSSHDLDCVKEKLKAIVEAGRQRGDELEKAFWWMWEVNPKIKNGLATLVCTAEQWKSAKAALAAPSDPKARAAWMEKHRKKEQ